MEAKSRTEDGNGATLKAFCSNETIRAHSERFATIVAIEQASELFSTSAVIPLKMVNEISVLSNSFHLLTIGMLCARRAPRPSIRLQHLRRSFAALFNVRNRISPFIYFYRRVCSSCTARNWHGHKKKFVRVLTMKAVTVAETQSGEDTRDRATE